MLKKFLIAACFFCFYFTSVMQAQQKTVSFEEFCSDAIATDGLFPVYQKEARVFLEIPSRYFNREVEIRAQINRGFELLNRPVKSIGVVRIVVHDSTTLYFQQPFYNERMAVKDTQQAAFLSSNVQPLGFAYPITCYSPRGGAIIEITEQLNGDDWFSYQFSFLRGLKGELSSLLRIHPFADGVTFTLQRYHESEGGENRFSNLAMALPLGSLPLELSCVFRLLPQKTDLIRLAHPRLPLQSVPFVDYSQDPYGAVEDSLVRHWDVSCPLVFHLDPLFPSTYKPAVRRSILAWNRTLRKIGVPFALILDETKYSGEIAEQRACISYDMRLPGVSGSLIHHPRTGEILSCRLNVGHGFMKEKMDEYLLLCGGVDQRIRDDRSHSEVEADLLEREVSRQIGVLLGLKKGFQDEICPAMLYAYSPFKAGQTCYEDRERMFHLIEVSKEKIDAGKTLWAQRLSSMPKGSAALQQLQDAMNELLSWLHKNKTTSKNLMGLYRKALQLYAQELSNIASIIGSSSPAEEQHEAMLQLERFLFSPSQEIGGKQLNTQYPELKKQVLYPELQKLFSNLLSSKTIASLQVQVFAGKNYGEVQFFDDLYNTLFNGFDTSSSVNYHQMDMQLLLLSAWRENVSSEKNINKTETIALATELKNLCERLERLKTEHSQAEVRTFSEYIVRRIK